MIVKQAANVLDILEYFAGRGKPASLAEVAQHFGWPRSSTFNLLTTLAARGYLYEPIGKGRFYPTPRWLVLAQEVVSAAPIPEDLIRLAQDLAATTGETTFIAAPDGLHAVFIEVVESRYQVRYAASVGARIPLHATASGQAILSQMTESRRAAILRKAVFERYGDGTPMSVEAVEDNIRRSLRRGWFQSASAYSVDLGGVSLPLVLAGRIVAITVAGPLFRVADKMQQTAIEMHAAVASHLGSDFLGKNVAGLTIPPTVHRSD